MTFHQKLYRACLKSGGTVPPLQKVGGTCTPGTPSPHILRIDCDTRMTTTSKTSLTTSETCLTIALVNFSLQIDDLFLHALELFLVATTLLGQLVVLGRRFRLFVHQLLAFPQSLPSTTKTQQKSLSPKTILSMPFHAAVYSIRMLL